MAARRRRTTMAAMIRLLFWLFLLPVRIVSWTIRRLYVALHGYNVLSLDVHGALPDRRGPAGLLSALSREPRGVSLLDTLRALDRARRDRRIQIVWLRLGPLHCGLARAEELRH